MRILFFGDYSNLHACLAKSLRDLGHEACVVSDRGGYMQTDADFSLKRRKGLGGSLKYLFDTVKLLPKLKDFDVVQFINRISLNLRPDKNRLAFDWLRHENRSAFLTLCGNDYYFVKACTDGTLFRFSEFRTGDKPTEFSHLGMAHEPEWLSDQVRKYTEYFYDRIDGAMSVLPEYDIAAAPVLGDKVTFTNIPVDLSNLPFTPFEIKGRIKVIVAIRPEYKIKKGTGRLLEICKRLESEMPDKISVEAVGGLSLNDYLDKIRHSHVVIDQLYAYSPATNALQTMALGRIAASGGEPEYYSYINEPDRRPIIPLSPLDPDIKETLRRYLLDRNLMEKMSAQGRFIVERENDSRIVARRFIEKWEKTLK